MIANQQFPIIHLQWVAGNKKYDAMSNYVDVQMRNYDEVLHVIAAATMALIPVRETILRTVRWSRAGNAPKCDHQVAPWDQATYAIASLRCGPAQDGDKTPRSLLVMQLYQPIPTIPMRLITEPVWRLLL